MKRRGEEISRNSFMLQGILGSFKPEIEHLIFFNSHTGVSYKFQQKTSEHESETRLTCMEAESLY